MGGYVAMSREWLEHDIFDGDVFSRRDAWAWLIASAAWRQTKARIKGHSVDLERGELSYSVRFMAEKWGWSKSAVDRFLKLLTREGMISMRSKTGTTAGHPAGQGRSEEHTSELQSLMRISYAVFCLKTKKKQEKVKNK